jgi:hypothetical protein
LRPEALCTTSSSENYAYGNISVCFRGNIGHTLFVVVEYREDMAIIAAQVVRAQTLALICLPPVTGRGSSQAVVASAVHGVAKGREGEAGAAPGSVLNGNFAHG